MLLAIGGAALAALSHAEGSAASLVQQERQVYAMSQADDDPGSATEGNMPIATGTEFTPFQIAIPQTQIDALHRQLDRP